MLLSFWGTYLTMAPAPAALRTALSQCTRLQTLKRWDQVPVQSQLLKMYCWRALDYSYCCWPYNMLPRCCLQAETVFLGQPRQDSGPAVGCGECPGSLDVANVTSGQGNDSNCGSMAGMQHPTSSSVIESRQHCPLEL